MRFNPELVWEAYRGLFRYVERIGSDGVLAIPKRLPAVLPPVNHPAAVAIAEDLEMLYRDHPISATDRYFAYVYLWAQLLRCSNRLGPTRTKAGEWWNLNWLPLRAYTGRSDEDRQNARATFRKWYYEWVQRVYPHPSERQLSVYFPWVPDYGEREIEVARHQLTAIRRLQTAGLPIGEILQQYDSCGHVRQSDESLDWHLWLLLAFPESWAAKLPGRHENAIIAMLQEADPKEWEDWRTLWCEAEPDVQERLKIFPGERRAGQGRFRPRDRPVGYLEELLNKHCRFLSRRRAIGTILAQHSPRRANENEMHQSNL